MQVYHISPEACYGVSDNSNGNTTLSYYLYPPPALNLIGATVSGLAQWLVLAEMLVGLEHVLDLHAPTSFTIRLQTFKPHAKHPEPILGLLGVGRDANAAFSFQAQTNLPSQRVCDRT